MDLNAPLGMTPPPPRRHRLLLLGGGLLLAVVVGAAAAMLALADPRGGRPYVVAEIPPPAPARPRPAALDTAPTGTLASSPPAAAPAAPAMPASTARVGSLEGGVMVYRGGGSGAAVVAPPEPLVIDVTHAIDDPLGKMRGAPSAGAKPAGAGASQGGAPRVAIFVSGMGLDSGATRTAIDTMPKAVTLAFVPYGSAVGANVEAARAKGHEVLLQLPMRNEGGGSPGPHALRPDAPAEVLKADLAWLMERFTGYDGIANLLGAPVTADAGVMTQVLKTARSRHLFYLDDGTSLQSVAGSLASDLGVEAVKTDLVIDATSDPAAVRANLDRLVATAKRNGSAVGMASGLPEHLGTIARFAAELGGRGVTLVPVSSLARVGGPAQPTAIR